MSSEFLEAEKLKLTWFIHSSKLYRKTTESNGVDVPVSALGHIELTLNYNPFQYSFLRSPFLPFLPFFPSFFPFRFLTFCPPFLTFSILLFDPPSLPAFSSFELLFVSEFSPLPFCVFF